MKYNHIQEPYTQSKEPYLPSNEQDTPSSQPMHKGHALQPTDPCNPPTLRDTIRVAIAVAAGEAVKTRR